MGIVRVVEGVLVPVEELVEVVDIVAYDKRWFEQMVGVVDS